MTNTVEKDWKSVGGSNEKTQKFNNSQDHGMELLVKDDPNLKSIILWSWILREGSTTDEVISNAR